MINEFEAILWILMGTMSIGFAWACQRCIKHLNQIDRDFELATWILHELPPETCEKVALELQNRRFT